MTDAPPKRGRGGRKFKPGQVPHNKGRALVANRKEARSAVPVIRLLVKIADETDLPVRRLTALAGIHQRTYENWKFGRRAPTLRDMEAVANALGYTLTLVPLEEPVSGV